MNVFSQTPKIPCLSLWDWLALITLAYLCVFSQLKLRVGRVSSAVGSTNTARISSPAVSTSAAAWMAWSAACRSAPTTYPCPPGTVPTRAWRHRRDAAVKSGRVTTTTASTRGRVTLRPISRTQTASTSCCTLSATLPGQQTPSKVSHTNPCPHLQYASTWLALWVHDATITIVSFIFLSCRVDIAARAPSSCSFLRVCPSDHRLVRMLRLLWLRRL